MLGSMETTWAPSQRTDGTSQRTLSAPDREGVPRILATSAGQMVQLAIAVEKHYVFRPPL